MRLRDAGWSVEPKNDYIIIIVIIYSNPMDLHQQLGGLNINKNSYLFASFSGINGYKGRFLSKYLKTFSYTDHTILIQAQSHLFRSSNFQHEKAQSSWNSIYFHFNKWKGKKNENWVNRIKKQTGMCVCLMLE